MSAFVCGNKTISLIAKAFETYGVNYRAENYDPSASYIGGCSAFIDSSKLVKAIGQSLLDQNYRSVNFRYDEETKTPEFKYTDIGDEILNLGSIIGCIDCYNYQACETPEYEQTDLYYSLERLKDEVYKNGLRRLGYTDLPWGID